MQLSLNFCCETWNFSAWCVFVFLFLEKNTNKFQRAKQRKCGFPFHPVTFQINICTVISIRFILADKLSWIKLYDLPIRRMRHPNFRWPLFDPATRLCCLRSLSPRRKRSMVEKQDRPARYDGSCYVIPLKVPSTSLLELAKRISTWYNGDRKVIKWWASYHL